MKKNLILAMTILLVAFSCTGALADVHGLGLYTSIASSQPAAEGKDGTAQVDTTVCALTLDDTNTIIAIRFDVAQTKIAIDSTGAILSDPSAEIKSKVELGTGYGMKGASAIGKELDEQIAALEAWCLGKTVDEAVSKVAAGDDADLLAGCTIKLEDYTTALAKAAMNAK